MRQARAKTQQHFELLNSLKKVKHTLCKQALVINNNEQSKLLEMCKFQKYEQLQLHYIKNFWECMFMYLQNVKVKLKIRAGNQHVM